MVTFNVSHIYFSHISIFYFILKYVKLIPKKEMKRIGDIIKTYTENVYKHVF